MGELFADLQLEGTETIALEDIFMLFREVFDKLNHNVYESRISQEDFFGKTNQYKNLYLQAKAHFQRSDPEFNPQGANVTRD